MDQRRRIRNRYDAVFHLIGRGIFLRDVRFNDLPAAGRIEVLPRVCPAVRRVQKDAFNLFGSVVQGCRHRFGALDALVAAPDLFDRQCSRFR